MTFKPHARKTPSAMSKPIEIPAGTPAAFLDLRDTARMYLDFGHKDYMSLFDSPPPPKEVPRVPAATIRRGMKQILQFRGLKPSDPLKGLDIDGFYALAEILGLSLQKQVLSEHRGETAILDEMHMAHSVTGACIVLYNLVPMTTARRAADHKRPRTSSSITSGPK